LAKEFADIHAVIGQVAKDYQYKEMFAIPQWLRLWWEQMQDFVRRIISEIIKKILEWFSKLGISFGDPGTSGKHLVNICLAVLCVFVAGIIIWQQRRWLKEKWLGKAKFIDSDEIGSFRTSLEWRARAMDFKEKGLLKEACRMLHRACLQMFDEANLIAFAPARSNFEYSLALSRISTPAGADPDGNLRKTFQKFSNVVDAVYFGNRAARETEFDFCLKSLQVVENYLSAQKPAE
jgi:hypothetical protein